MGRFHRGVLTGLGVGWLLGWSLGVSGIIPGRGWPLWAATIAGIALIFLGGSGARPRLSEASPNPRPPQEDG